jgi:hypothetical protein
MNPIPIRGNVAANGISLKTRKITSLLFAMLRKITNFRKLMRTARKPEIDRRASSAALPFDHRPTV